MFCVFKSTNKRENLIIFFCFLSEREYSDNTKQQQLVSVIIKNLLICKSCEAFQSLGDFSSHKALLAMFLWLLWQLLWYSDTYRTALCYFFIIYV